MRNEVRNIACQLGLLLGVTTTGCGDDGPMGTDSAGSSTTSTTTGATPVPGYAVNCDPDADPAVNLICMRPEDWDCSHRDHYTREFLCAYVLGGTPADYDDKPMIEGGMIDCANPPPNVEDAWSDVGTGCDDCRVCGDQLAGISKYEFGPPDPPGWDEHPWCPQDYETLREFCNDGPVDPTEGPPPEPEPPGVWICNGSPTICGTMQDSTPPNWQNTVCMSANIPDCVLADDVSEARTYCEELCEWKDEALEMQAIDNSWLWINFDCSDLYYYPTPPVEATDPLNQCSGAGPMWLIEPLPFTGNAQLDFFGGSYATSSQLSGVLDFSVGTCAAGVCDVTLSELRAITSDVHGVYHWPTPGSGWMSSPFEIADLEVRTLQPVTGQLTELTDVITFPSEDLYAVLSSSSTDLGATPVNNGFDDRLIVIQNMSGTWDGTILTLDIEWATPDGFLQFEMQLTN